MPLWKEVDIKWDGQTVRVKPTFALFQSIEQLGSFDTVLVVKAMQNELPIGWCCEIVARALYSAGLNVSAEDVFCNQESVANMHQDTKAKAYNILAAFSQAEETEKEEGKKKADQQKS